MCTSDCAAAKAVSKYSQANKELRERIAVLEKEVSNLSYVRDNLWQRLKRANYKLAVQPCSCQVPQGPRAWPT